MWRTKKYWMNQSRYWEDLYRKENERNEKFREDVFEKETIKELKAQVDSFSSRIDTLMAVNRTLEDCNQILKEALKK